MAAIRAGLLNQGLGQFHGLNYYKNINYQGRYPNQDGGFESQSESDSDDSSEGSRIVQRQSQNYAENIASLEKRRILMAKKNEFIEKTEKTLKILDTFIVLLGISGTIAANIESEMYYRNNNSDNDYSTHIRGSVSITTIILLVMIAVHASLDYKITKEKREAPEEDVPDFFFSHNFWIMIVELILNAVHCPPWVHKVFVSEQLGGTLTVSINEVCAAIMLLRVYLLVKLFRYYTKWTSSHSKKICETYGAQANWLFSVKSILKIQPFYILIPLILISIIIFSVSTRIFERHFALSNSSQDYSYIWNSAWLVMLTMTTVGYGDFFPRTHIGRFIIVLSCIWGIFIISMMIVTLSNFILFTNEEDRSFEYIKKVKALKASKRFARLYVKKQLEQYLYYRKCKHDPNINLVMEEMNLLIKFYIKKFKDYRHDALFSDLSAAEMLTVLNERISMQIFTIRKHLNLALKIHENLHVAIVSQNKIKENLDSSIKHIQDLRRITNFIS
ncbi:hypothetical protein SteCoe_5572 [Stentor coeruleus]|uniref:Potassium channel domain-containing protein n=1 Tax=Stentor coeruleus TaxID=5963 RepID=A0A1R2CS09_9CILI|nr:hypothetical protein SteCoe_5572 [Stentor coeruleus]